MNIHDYTVMISPAVHASYNVAALINDVVRCHTDMVQTVHGLKIQVAVMDTQNRHLIEREDSGRECPPEKY